MISFCTWILDRLQQFREVLPLNLARTAGINCEFVILDIGSTDGLGRYLRGWSDQRIRYVREPWATADRHFARLYNASHSMARGNLLVALDADNAIGEKYCTAVHQWCTDHSFLWAWSGDWTSGTVGRVAFQRDVFWGLGGYDESLGPVGYQDIDLMNRARASGLRRRLIQDPDVVGHAIPNSRAETANCLGLSEQLYRRINSENAAHSRDNIAAGRLIANV